MAAKERTNGDEKFKSGDQVTPLLEPNEFARIGQRNVEFMSRAARAYFNGATEMNKEFAEFFNRRMKKDFETARSVMSSKNGQDAISTQAVFFADAFRDYAEEASRVFSIASDAAREALSDPEK